MYLLMYFMYLYDFMFLKFLEYLYFLGHLLPLSNVMRNIFSIIPLTSILYCVSSSPCSPSSAKIKIVLMQSNLRKYHNKQCLLMLYPHVSLPDRTCIFKSYLSVSKVYNVVHH